MGKPAKRERKPRHCAYCLDPELPEGERLTRDHVLPKSLFNVLDPQMVTVAACKRCQAEKSYGEDDLRDYVNLHWAGARHPEAEKQQLKILSSTLLGRSKLGNAFLHGGSEERLTTPSGLDLGPVWAVTIPDENRDMMRTLEYIVRGLYAHERCTPLPSGWPVGVKSVDTLSEVQSVLRLFASVSNRIEP